MVTPKEVPMLDPSKALEKYPSSVPISDLVVRFRLYLLLGRVLSAV